MDPDANAELDNDIRLSLSDTVSASSNPEGLVLLANAAKRVWEELYVSKKPVRTYTIPLSLFNQIDLH